MATSNSPTFGQSNSPRQDGQIINLLVCLVLTPFLGNFSPDEPEKVIDLLARVTTASVETVKVVNELRLAAR